MLEQSDIAHYLLSLGVVKPREVIDEDFRVVDASRRNCVFLATTRSGPTFVVKHGEHRSTLAHEATVLRLLEAEPDLAPHVPTVVHEEPGCLVLRTPAGARDLGEDRSRFPVIPARSLGRTLARLHRLPANVPPSDGPLSALDLVEPPHALVLELSAAAQDLLRRIQASEELCDRLAKLRDAPSGDAFVHGDLRWDNCLALPAPGATRRTRVLLVDWELAGRADPAFDVGSMLAEHLRAWVASIPIVDGTDPGRFTERARHPVAVMRPAMEAFWTGYRDAHPSPPALRRVVELTAARLLQIAIEVARRLAATTAHVVTLLQLADNMLREPDIAAAGVLRLRE
jgi:aminoglycoside phosphotransferase (APT) family kinase protein